jgi:hypothetical protein
MTYGKVVLRGLLRMSILAIDRNSPEPKRLNLHQCPELSSIVPGFHCPESANAAWT